MQTQKAWSKPELNVYGSVEDITEQTFSKDAGTSDSIVFIIGGVTTTITAGEQGTLAQIS
ncbi:MULTISPECIES: hypothetical protein [unclassified Anabaena]|uniref:hypothetical protein n=1 Tax=unclassified Anabaena TaxID=2619674 RepID=UPI0039C73A07